MATKEWKEQNQDRMKQYRKEYYHRNKESEKTRIRKRTEDLGKFLKDYKNSGLSCQRCGENHPATLQFHHKDPSLKTVAVSSMVAHGYSKDKILEEISKCEVLCANCHFKEHYTRV